MNSTRLTGQVPTSKADVMADRSDAERRAEALRQLIEMTVPVEQAVTELAEFGRSAPRALATVTSTDAVRVLDGFLDGSLPAEDCRRWAGALRARRDLAVGRGGEQLLRAFLFELATPQLFRPLSREFATRWKRRLTTAH
ncbi:MAG TPA: hypothetical protein VIS06_16500 [Mycobacteriales bacterium]|jgi:hypothetical protein